MICGFGRLFIVSSLSYDFSVVGFNSPFLRLFLFFPCFSWYRCAELITRSFGLFYPELCGSLMAWAHCLCLFSLLGGSYFLAGGCDSDALDMCFLIRGDFDISVIILPLTRFLGFLCWCLIALFCAWGISLFQILSFYLLWPLFVLVKTLYGKVS